MTPPINIDGSTVGAITIDGTDVSEVTVDGSTVFGNAIPDAQNLQANLDAQALSLSDQDAVDPWSDESGNNNDFDGFNSPIYETDIVGSNPAVLGDGSSHYFQRSNLLGDVFSFYLVFVTSNSSDSMETVATYHNFDSDIEGLRTRINQDDGLAVEWGDGSSKSEASFSWSGYADGSGHILGVRLDATTGEIDVNLDDATDSATDSTVSTISHGSNMQLMRDTDGFYFDGHHAHHLIYPGVKHDASTADEVVSFLQSHWGI